MLLLEVTDAQRNQFVVAGDEPYRVVTMDGGPTYVYADAWSKEGLPGWEPALVYDPDNDVNVSCVSIGVGEYHARRSTPQPAAAERLMQEFNLLQSAAELLARRIHHPDGMYWNGDCLRYQTSLDPGERLLRSDEQVAEADDTP